MGSIIQFFASKTAFCSDFDLLRAVKLPKKSRYIQLNQPYIYFKTLSINNLGRSDPIETPSSSIGIPGQPGLGIELHALFCREVLRLVAKMLACCIY